MQEKKVVVTLGVALLSVICVGITASLFVMSSGNAIAQGTCNEYYHLDFPNLANPALYRVSTSTGHATLVHQYPTNAGIGTLAMNSQGQMYSHAAVGGVDYIVRLDSNGVITPIVPLSSSGGNATLAFGPDGMMYTLSTADDSLYRINPSTGQVTFVRSYAGQIDVAGSDIAFTPTQLVYVGHFTGQVYVIDLNTWAATLVGSMPPATTAGDYPGLAYINGAFYTANNHTDSLYRFTVSPFSWTDMGPLGVDFIGAGDAASCAPFAPPPPPPPLSATCVASPNPANVNQPVIFTPQVSGGVGNYNYAWTGACNGFTQSCQTSFSTQGTHAAFLHVTSGNQAISTSCSANVVQSCTPHAKKKCVGSSLYWFDSCGNQEDLIQVCSGSQSCQVDQCVNILCNADSDCGQDGPVGSNFCQDGNVYKNFRKFTCHNPGSIFSTCSQTTNPQLQQTCSANQTCSNGSCNTVNIACKTNLDCGTNGLVGSPFCKDNGVYQKFKTFTCNNPNSVQSFCSNNTQDTLIRMCASDQNCNNGSCQNRPPVCTSHSFKRCVGRSVYWFDSCGKQEDLYQACTVGQACSDEQCLTISCQQNSDCGANGYVDSPYCDANQVYQNYKTYTCHNPGTPSSTCTNVTQPRVKQVCLQSQTCSDGNCAGVACHQSSDCGTDAFTGSPFCQDGNVFRNYKTFKCNSPGTANSSCTDSTAPKLATTCLGTQTCLNGACKNQPVRCERASDCGVDTFVGNPYCKDGDVYRDFKTHTCSNPGTSSSSCSDSTAPKLITDCLNNQSCSNGACTNVMSISCSATPNPANVNQNVTFTAQVAGGLRDFVYSWTGACTGVGQTCQKSFSQSGSQTAFLSVTSGNQTLNTSCSVTVNQAQTITCTNNSDCGTNAFVGSNYCQNGKVYRDYKTFTCNNPGTTTSSCSESTAAQLQQTCATNQACTNGACSNNNIVCSNNSDCGSSGYVGGSYCQGNNVYRNYRTYTCNNPGSTNSSCSDSTSSQLQNTCSNTCSNGSCNTQNQTSTLLVTKSVRNLTQGNLNWSNSVYANPGDYVQFQITVQGTGNQSVNNVTVRDVLPANLQYRNALTLDAIANSGDIVAGLNIGNVSAGQTRTITYQAQVASAQYFAFGTTTLTNSVSVTSSDSGFNTPNAASASVIVTRTGIHGVTAIPTGLGNNLLVDSFFIPLVLLGIWLWMRKSKLLVAMGVTQWIPWAKPENRQSTLERELAKKIEKIKEREI